MASNIDPSQPPASNPTTAAMRANMSAAKAEIEALQKNALTPAQCLLMNVSITDNTVLSASGLCTLNYAKALFDEKIIDTHNVGNLTTSRIAIPAGATHISLTGHLSFPSQSVGNGRASVHLWRYIPGDAEFTDFGLAHFTGVYDADRPTPEANYHNRAFYPADAVVAQENYTSIIAPTGFIPIFSPQEEWSLYAWQNSGAPIVLETDFECWLWAEFKF